MGGVEWGRIFIRNRLSSRIDTEMVAGDAPKRSPFRELPTEPEPGTTARWHGRSRTLQFQQPETRHDSHGMPRSSKPGQYITK